MQQLMAQQAVLMAQNELIMQRLGASRIWQQSCRIDPEFWIYFEKYRRWLAMLNG
jgi:hypothetical protein